MLYTLTLVALVGSKLQSGEVVLIVNMVTTTSAVATTTMIQSTSVSPTPSSPSMTTTEGSVGVRRISDNRRVSF